MCSRSGIPASSFSRIATSPSRSVVNPPNRRVKMSSAVNAAATASMTFSTLYATFPNEAEARDLARKLVQERLANFVHVMNTTMDTFYCQNNGDEVQTDKEVLMTAKILTRNAARVVEFVTENSPVEEAEVYTVPITHLSDSMRTNLLSTLH